MQDLISIEKVLNSRCSSDFDGNSKKNHWGLFIKGTYPPKEILRHMLEHCRVPQFSNGKLSSWFEGQHLFLGFEKTDDPFKTRLLHIESGMQQQAVYLSCTALGLGACINNLGINGTEYGDKIATASFLVSETVAAYGTKKFSTAVPGPEKSFRKGKILSEPKRDGNKGCLKEMRLLKPSEDSGTRAGETDISQLLWAAKGRTPHYIKSHAWGLTIPTWGGGQNYTDIYLLKANKLFRYINWTIQLFKYIWATPLSRYWCIVGNPTHDIKPVGNVNVSSELDDAKIAIIARRNEKTNRALWEVGYMIENMLLQARSLGISYKTKVFTSEETQKLKIRGLPNAVAALLL